MRSWSGCIIWVSGVLSRLGVNVAMLVLLLMIWLMVKVLLIGVRRTAVAMVVLVAVAMSSALLKTGSAKSSVGGGPWKLPVDELTS